MTPARLIAGGFGAGWLPKAPGTWGSLAALLPAAAVQYAGGPLALAIATAGVAFIGLWAIQACGESDADPGWIVIDEVTGQWLALLPAALDWRLYVAGFVLFRLFDIAKPWPIGWADRALPGAAGIMTDDLLAGIYAAVGVGLLAHFMETL